MIVTTKDFTIEMTAEEAQTVFPGLARQMRRQIAGGKRGGRGRGTEKGKGHGRSRDRDLGRGRGAGMGQRQGRGQSEGRGRPAGMGDKPGRSMDRGRGLARRRAHLRQMRVRRRMALLRQAHRRGLRRGYRLGWQEGVQTGRRQGRLVARRRLLSQARLSSMDGGAQRGGRGPAWAARQGRVRRNHGPGGGRHGGRHAGRGKGRQDGRRGPAGYAYL